MLTTTCQRFPLGARVVCTAPYFSEFHRKVGTVVYASLREQRGARFWVYNVDFPGAGVCAAAFPLTESELAEASATASEAPP